MNRLSRAATLIFVIPLCLFSLWANAEPTAINKSEDGIDVKKKAEMNESLKKHGVAFDDFKDLDFTNCGLGPDENILGILGWAKKDISSKEFSAPKNSRVVFCGDQIDSVVAEKGELVRLWQFKCDGKFDTPHLPDDPSNKNQVYQCVLLENHKVNGVDLPKGVWVLFSKDGRACFAPNRKFRFQGKSYDKAKYYKIENAQLTQVKSLNEDCIKQVSK